MEDKVDYNEVLARVEKPMGKTEIVTRYQNTGDIIKDLLYMYGKYKYQAHPVAQLFNAGSLLASSKRIWGFIKDNIKYEAEPEKDQTTRSFSRIIHDKWGDCKHSALIATSIGNSLGYDVIPKFVNYEDKTRHYGHVYTLLADPKTGEKVIIDPLQDFNYEKPYLRAMNYKHINPKNKNMTLSRLTGTDDDGLAGVGELYDIPGGGTVRMITGDDLMSGVGKLKKPIIKPLLKASATAVRHPIKSALHPAATAKSLVKTVAPKAASKIPTKGAKPAKQKGKLKAKIKSKGAKLKENIKSRGGAVKTIALLPVRAAATVLILANYRGWASRMKKLQQTDPAAANDFAKRYGYVPATFFKQVNQGAAKKPLFGSKANGIAGIGDMVAIEGIGIISVAAAITTAAPFIYAITKLFKAHNLQEPGDDAAELESVANMDKAPDIAAEGGDLPDSSGEGRYSAERSEAGEGKGEGRYSAERSEAGEGKGEGRYSAERDGDESDPETVEGPINKKKFADTLEKVEALTRAADKGAKVYKAATTVKKVVKPVTKEEIEPEAKSFFEQVGDSFKEHPVIWLGSTAAVIGLGGYLFTRKH